MRKKCKDPVCPANKHSTSKTKPLKSKKPKRTPSRKHVATTSKASTKPEKKRSKSKCRSTRSKTYSHIKTCRNKRCQASRLTVESSTSTSVPQKICVRSKDSVKSGKLKHVSRPSKRTICHCGDPRLSPSSAKTKTKTKTERRSRSRCKKSARRESDRKKKLLPALCVCVRGTRSTSRNSKSCECPSKCAILTKYDECCCAKNKRKRSKKKEVVNNRRNSSDSRNRISRDRNSPNKCPCTSTSKSSRNIIRRGLSNLRKRIRKLKNSTRYQYPKYNNLREYKTCPVKKCCSKISLKKQYRQAPVSTILPREEGTVCLHPHSCPSPLIQALVENGDSQSADCSKK